MLRTYVVRGGSIEEGSSRFATPQKVRGAVATSSGQARDGNKLGSRTTRGGSRWVGGEFEASSRPVSAYVVRTYVAVQGEFKAGSRPLRGAFEAGSRWR